MNKEKKVCIICGNTDIKFVTSYRATNVIFSNTQIVECNSCGMVFADPMPSEISLKNYNASYFTNAPDGLTVSKVASAYYYAIASLRYEYVQQFLKCNNIIVNSVLEIGPGPGYFAENWILHHPNNTYFVIESDTSCHTSLNKVGVQLIDDTTDLKNERGIDLVVISHVLEHVSKPDDFLLSVTKPLIKGGALFIEVPCQDWKHKPTDEPHLLFFDKKPMKILLNKIGFDNVITDYFGQKIEMLLKRTLMGLLLKKLQDKLIAIGIIWPFAKKRPGMETLQDPLQRAAVAQFEAHQESSEPAWWLRALAVKTSG